MNAEHHLKVYFPLLPVSIWNSNSLSIQSWTSWMFVVSTLCPRPAPPLSRVQGAVGMGGVR